MSGLARFSRCALRTLQPKIFSLVSQKRFRRDKPVYDLPPTDKLGKFFPEYASSFHQMHLDALRVSYEPAEKYEVIPNIKGTNYIIILHYINNPLSRLII